MSSEPAPQVGPPRTFNVSARGVRNAASAAVRVLKTVVAGKPLILPTGTIVERRAICQQCDRRSGVQCMECECLIRGKTMLSTENCPLGKWPEIVDEEETQSV